MDRRRRPSTRDPRPSSVRRLSDICHTGICCSICLFLPVLLTALDQDCHLADLKAVYPSTVRVVQ